MNQPLAYLAYLAYTMPIYLFTYLIILVYYFKPIDNLFDYYTILL